LLPQIRRRWYDLHRQQLHTQAQASDVAAVLNGATKFVRIALQSLALGFGALLVLEGNMTPGGMIAASILTGRAWRRWNCCGQLEADRRRPASLRAAARLLGIHAPREQGMSLPKPRGQVSVEAASAAAPGTQRLILKNLTFSIARARWSP